MPGGERGEALAQRARRRLRGHAIQIASRRSCRGRRVGHLAGVGGGYTDAVDADAQLVRDDLRDLGVEPLTHFGPAVIEQHRAVGIQVDQRPGLVVVRRREGDAELHRCERDAPLEDGARTIPRGDLRATLAVARAQLEARGELGHHVVFDPHPVWRLVARREPVEVGAADIERVETEMTRDLVSTYSIANMPWGPP